MENRNIITVPYVTSRQQNALLRFMERINVPYHIEKAEPKTLNDVVCKAEADFVAGRSRSFTLDELDEFVNALR